MKHARVFYLSSLFCLQTTNLSDIISEKYQLKKAKPTMIRIGNSCMSIALRLICLVKK